MTARSLLSSQTARTDAVLPLLEKGFRPFFLLGAAFAALAVPLWLLALRGGLQPGGAFGAMQWHAHEMLFGFCSAIICGFLLTAVSNWTGRETATGWRLAALAVLWLLGRLAMFFAEQLPRYLPAVLDLALLPALAVSCALPLILARSQRNYGFIGLLLGLSLANGIAHSAALLGDLATVRIAHRVALDVIVLMLVLVTGRIVPMFTRNAVRLAWIRSVRSLELGSIAALLVLTVTDVWLPLNRFSAASAGAAGVLLLARMRFWGSSRTGGEPLLWILHVGTLWLPLGLLLRAASPLTPLALESSSLHALTAGAIGLLTLGMMARVSLGHTGRMLRAPLGMNAAFLCLLAAGLVRVVAPLLPSSQYLAALTLATVAWSAAFALFLARYWTILVSARADAG
ncbi:MAG TPA: NnrS family protein [Polyangiaceae bacterium]|nr:NnrS family protein [Polyangiaceae bacterium]